MTKPNSPNSEKVPKKSLIVTISCEPEKDEQLKNFIVSAIVEYMGIWLEHKQTDKKNSHVALFDKIGNGEEFYKMFENTHLEVSKEEN